MLTLVGGDPGAGKSTLAAGIADRTGWTVLRSDEVRKDLAGVGHTTGMAEPRRARHLRRTGDCGDVHGAARPSPAAARTG